MVSDKEREAQEIFNKLKEICVPILGHSAFTPSSIFPISELVSNLILTLRDIRSTGFVLTPSLVAYTFFPLSTILRRNPSSTIPDQVLERILVVLSILWEDWWWDCDLNVWEQSFMLCGAVMGGIEEKGKTKNRDDETKTAAVECLFSLLRERTMEESMQHSRLLHGYATRLAEFQAHIQATKAIPLLGQTLNSLLITAESHHPPLQRISMRTLQVLISVYAPDDFLPSILPGVASCMTKIALGKPGRKTWANGDIVASALKVMQEIIVKSIGDDICTKEGAVRGLNDIDDLVELVTEPNVSPTRGETRPYSTIRTQSWLRGTASQLHIALNTLTPLVSHPTPSALLAFIDFSSTILAATVLTLPQTQILLLSFLLSLSNSTFPTVASGARDSLLRLLAPASKARTFLLQSMMQSTRENLTALPRLLLSHADDKVEHIAGLIEAVCRLTVAQGCENLSFPDLRSISSGIGKLLGPTGGIEKWGWGLLSVLEFENPSVNVPRTSSAQLMLESSLESTGWSPFPELTFKHVSSLTAKDSLVRMFRSLGYAGRDGCLYSIEWFTNAGRHGSSVRSVAALWCACRLLEGVGDVSLDSESISNALRDKRSKRLEKLARGLARELAELWDDEEGSRLLDPTREQPDDGDDNYLPVEHRKGTVSIRATPGPARYHERTKPQDYDSQLSLRKAFCLQFLSISAGILQARFTPLLRHVLYPLLHSLVSSSSHLSSTALASLSFITTSISYASVANLLLSNFDYALDAVSRRLSRRWLDVDAAKVLVVLVRLVGSDVVQKAGDVVEECFDRLDDFHGYEIIVENLVLVLGEVIAVLKADEEAAKPSKTEDDANTRPIRDSERTDVTADNPLRGDGEKHDVSAKGEDANHNVDADAEPPSTPTQALTNQIVSRSLYFLTHESPIIRARVLTLLSSSVPVLHESTLLPKIHHAWPFVLNRLADSEPFVVTAATALIESLATHAGGFMFRRIWDDVWPRFRVMLGKLDAADATNALARRGPGAVGTESANTHSHRLYRSLLRTMTAVLRMVQAQDSSVWQVILAFRRFLHSQAHDELQACARDLYVAAGMNNEDAVWLALSATVGQTESSVSFLRESKWDTKRNISAIFDALQ